MQDDYTSQPQAAPVSTNPPGAAVPAAAAPTPVPAAAGQPTASKLDPMLDWIFRIGFGSVFLINSLTAIIEPEGFRALIEGNFIARAIGFYDLQLYAIAVNDLLLGVLILTGKWRKFVLAWSGIWLAIVTFFKLTGL